MTHSETIRAGTARDRSDVARPAPELRWHLLDEIAAARETWGLKDRTLQVLRALLGFLPRGERLRLTVFPSNRKLSERLLGMPESTLRRHLAKLIDAGLIARRRSPNGKRFRVGDDPDLAFGLDLGPLFAAAHRIREAAEAARAERQEVSALKTRLRLALDALDPDHAAQALRPLLRRKLPAAALRDALDRLPPKTDVGGARNDCHIHSQDRIHKPSDTDPVAIALERVSDLAEMKIANERDLDEASERAALALGAGDAWRLARARQGAAWAAMALAYTAARMDVVRHPGRYLAGLTRRAQSGRFDLGSALTRLPVGS